MSVFRKGGVVEVYGGGGNILQRGVTIVVGQANKKRAWQEERKGSKEKTDCKAKKTGGKGGKTAPELGRAGRKVVKSPRKRSNAKLPSSGRKSAERLGLELGAREERGSEGGEKSTRKELFPSILGMSGSRAGTFMGIMEGRREVLLTRASLSAKGVESLLAVALRPY